ncbi:unnamed protein product [Rhizoctonia solani]|uniref:T6SS Phospholipase effector Tle1-like catalytic domain-containing protein n=1 Tax=Rhizoctonia solani TaxID=456999 RepID=A0A8H3CE14_9AGAM|nr:unnamed protein product [Rhizoctonia solani]
MVSDPRLALLKSHEKYDLRLERLPEGVYIFAVSKHDLQVYYDPGNSMKLGFNLSSYVGIRDNSLVWGLSGFDKNPSVENYEIWPHPATKERYLRVELRTPGSDSGSNPQVINLDDRLDTIEYYDPDWKEVRLRLGLKPESSKRSIILCFDGTSNHFSDRNTNVVKLVELLKKDDPLQQMVYYQTGVGTYSHPGFLTGLGLTLAAKIDEGVAWYLYQHVKSCLRILSFNLRLYLRSVTQVIDGYKYLMETYRAGDQISIFGFSRGAYTARALAGMLHSVGLLPRHNMEQVPFAYQIYEASQEVDQSNSSEKNILGAVDVKPRLPDTRNVLFRCLSKFMIDKSTRPENVIPEHFKMVFCTPIQIAFLGVWDTVGSVGALTKKSLPWVEYNPSVRYFRQALALDENRGNFIPSLWDHSRDTEREQDVLEVWFKGGHSDIGGGAPQSSTIGMDDKLGRSPELSNISLRWMVRQCLKCGGVRVLFDPDSLRRYRNANILEDISPWATESEIRDRGEEKKPELLRRFPESKLSELRDFHLATEAELEELKATKHELHARRIPLDSFDVTPAPYKAIKYSPLWWFLEILPIPKLSQHDRQRSWFKTAWCPNLGSARSTNRRKRTDAIKLHYSVSTHIENYSRYKPAAKWHSVPEVEEDPRTSLMPSTVKTKLNKAPGSRDNSLIYLTYALAKNPVTIVAGHIFVIGAISMATVNGGYLEK